MKKSLFVLGVAVAALASCTNEEVLNIAESNAIRFDNAFVGNATKAVTAPEVTTGNIEDMYVFAVDGTGANVFDVNPKNVYKIGGTEEWGYDKPVLWEDTKTYNFIAYAGKELKGETDDKVEQDNTSHKLKFTNITVDGARYTYAACPDTVVLRCADGRVVVLNAPDPAATRALCEELAARVG